MYGWTKTEAVGQKTHILFKTKSSNPIGSIENHLKQEGKWSGELFHRTKLGQEVSIQSYWLAKFDGHHEISEIFESNVDITERKNAERLAAIGATAGMVGHDIRNPLQSIIGELFLSRKELDDLPESESKKNMRESIDSIECNVTYINKIVTDLQDYAKPMSPCIEEVDFEKLVGTVLSMLQAPENIEIFCSIEPNFPKLMTDAAAMKRILTNLATNAVQAMPNGGKLSIKVNYEDGKALVQVEDTGVGISKEVKEKIFTPLFTTKARGQGFGLPVVKKLTDALNGKITLESEVGRGTRFALEFPQRFVSSPLNKAN